MKLHASVFKNKETQGLSNIRLSARVEGGYCHFLSERNGLTDAAGFTPEQAKTVVHSLTFEQKKFDFIIVEDKCCGSRRLRAIPAELILSGKWTMFGGNFIWSGDSRFFESPVKIYDWVES